MEHSRNRKEEARINGDNSCRKTRCPLHSRNYAFKADQFQLKELQLIIQRRTDKHPSTWRSNIPYQKFTLNPPQQAMTARINIGRDVTIVSLYNSRSHDISENVLSTLFQQLPKPVTLTGDFNSYNQIRGSPVNDNRGDKVLTFNDKNRINNLNYGGHTRTSVTSKSAVDLTLASTFFTAHPILECHRQSFM